MTGSGHKHSSLNWKLSQPMTTQLKNKFPPMNSLSIKTIYLRAWSAVGCQHKMRPIVFVLQSFVWASFFYYRSFACILLFLFLCFDGISVFANMCVSASICFLYFFFDSAFLRVSFFQFRLVLFYIIFRCLFSNEKAWERMGMWLGNELGNI